MYATRYATWNCRSVYMIAYIIRAALCVACYTQNYDTFSRVYFALYSV